MNKLVEDASKALDVLGAAIVSGSNDEKTFCEAWGWNCPAVTRHDAASLATSLASEIRAAEIKYIDEATAKYLGKLPQILMAVQTATLPHFWGGNNGAAYAAYLSTISTIRASLQPLLGWQTIPDPKSLPVQTLRKLKSLQTNIESITFDKEKFQHQIEEIAQAHSVAESLPLTLKELADARQKIIDLEMSAEMASNQTRQHYKSATGTFKAITECANEADKLIKQCEEAYRATTTKGLAAAFDKRASRLGWVVLSWVVGLIAALGIGSYLGTIRLEALTRTITANSSNWSVVLLHMVLSALSIGAPIWFAWLATKQIGQRFRLAEDYAFKATVAKAYEGYRREAARVDPEFEARLFSSALTRLEEAPLRLVDPVSHGSPWHEMLSAPEFQRITDAMPEFKENMLKLVREAASKSNADKAAATILPVSAAHKEDR